MQGLLVIITYMQTTFLKNTNQMLSVLDASEIIGVSADTIRRWDKRGIIKAHRSPLNHRLFNIEELKKIQAKLFGTSTENNYKILKVKQKSKFKVIDLFAGAGGTALGLDHAGLNHVLLNEIDKNSVATLKLNRKDWNVVHEDIAKIDFSKYRGKVDVVEGGFPCQAFSYAGNKKGFEDARGTLFFEFARCVKEVNPKIVMGENVKGLLKHEGGKTLDIMINILKELGYRVAYKVVRSQYHDVPQKRERLIIIGIRNDLKNMSFFFPKEKDYTVSLREAFKGCPVSEGQKYPKRKKEIMEKVPPGGCWRDLPENLQKEYMKASFFMGGGKTGMARRLSWDEPSLTLTCAPAQKQTERCHPEETRPLTVREYARIQTFPDDWAFSGSASAQYKQIGNAVPPNLGFHMGRCIIAMLEKKLDENTMIVFNKEGFLG